MIDPRKALQRIRGWADASVESLDGGLMNRTYHVRSRDGEEAVLRLDDDAPRGPRNSRAVEALHQSAAHAVGLAGCVYYHDEDCLLAEYLPGRVWTPADFAEDGSLLRLGGALRRLHALHPRGTLFDARSAARYYARRITADAPGVRDCLAVIDSIPNCEDPRFCHNDLVAGNIVGTKQLRFLDWEYAGDNDPLFDLATIVEHHDLGEAQADILLGAYCDGDAGPVRQRFAAQRRLYGALLWLWNAARGELPAVS